MKLVFFVSGLAVFVAACVFSFDYVEGHDATNKRAEITDLKLKNDDLSEKLASSKEDKTNVDEQLKQACSLLQAAEIGNDICPEVEDKEEGIDVSD